MRGLLAPLTRCEWAAGLGASLAYVAAVMPLNVWCDANFGYVGPELPRRRSILDLLGPWPTRLVWIILIGSAVTLLASLPWEWRKRHERHVAGGTGAIPR